MNFVFNSFLPLLQADGGAGQFMSFIPIVAIIVIFYFMIMRPQSKKQKEAQKMLEALKRGDRVVTIGGIRGTVHSLKDQTVVLKVDDNTKIEFTKSAVSAVLDAKEAKSDKTKVEPEAEIEQETEVKNEEKN